MGTKEQKREVASELSFWLYFSPNLSNQKNNQVDLTEVYGVIYCMEPYRNK